MSHGTPARILVTPRSLTETGLNNVPELELLRTLGYQLIAAPAGRVPTEEELLDLVPGCVGWLAGVEHIGAGVLEAAKDLRVISRNGTGTDAIDLEAAERAGVRVERAAGANAQEWQSSPWPLRSQHSGTSRGQPPPFAPLVGGDGNGRSCKTAPSVWSGSAPSDVASRGCSTTRTHSAAAARTGPGHPAHRRIYDRECAPGHGPRGR
jgi:hypothetical protein